MSYLSKMYGRKSPDQTQSSSDKNPNRVAGGLRAQGVDTVVMLGEDGSQQEVPSLAYVRSLEEQSKKQRAAITVLERKLTRQEAAIEQLKGVINRS
jgi:ABC-type hemin transport system substrate-binding protein